LGAEIPEGYKETPVGVIPEEWDVKKIGDISTIKGGNGFPERYQGNNMGDVPFIKVSDMNSRNNQKYVVEANNYCMKICFITSDLETMAGFK